MLKMNWFLLIFLLKVLTFVTGAPIDVVDNNDESLTTTEFLQDIIRQGFVVTDDANNLANDLITIKNDNKFEGNLEFANSNFNENESSTTAKVEHKSADYRDQITTLSPSVNYKESELHRINAEAQPVDNLEPLTTLSPSINFHLNESELHKITAGEQQNGDDNQEEITTLGSNIDINQSELSKDTEEVQPTTLRPLLNTDEHQSELIKIQAEIQPTDNVEQTTIISPSLNLLNQATTVTENVSSKIGDEFKTLSGNIEAGFEHFKENVNQIAENFQTPSYSDKVEISQTIGNTEENSSSSSSVELANERTPKTENFNNSDILPKSVYNQITSQFEENLQQNSALNSTDELVHEATHILENFANTEKVPEETEAKVIEISSTTNTPILSLFDSFDNISDKVATEFNNVKENIGGSWDNFKENLNSATQDSPLEHTTDKPEENLEHPTTLSPIKFFINEGERVLENLTHNANLTREYTEGIIENLTENIQIIPEEIDISELIKAATDMVQKAEEFQNQNTALKTVSDLLQEGENAVEKLNEKTEESLGNLTENINNIHENFQNSEIFKTSQEGDQKTEESLERNSTFKPITDFVHMGEQLLNNVATDVSLVKENLNESFSNISEGIRNSEVFITPQQGEQKPDDSLEQNSTFKPITDFVQTGEQLLNNVTADVSSVKDNLNESFNNISENFQNSEVFLNSQQGEQKAEENLEENSTYKPIKDYVSTGEKLWNNIATDVSTVKENLNERLNNISEGFQNSEVLPTSPQTAEDNLEQNSTYKPIENFGSTGEKFWNNVAADVSAVKENLNESLNNISEGLENSKVFITSQQGAQKTEESMEQNPTLKPVTDLERTGEQLVNNVAAEVSSVKYNLNERFNNISGGFQNSEFVITSQQEEQKTEENLEQNSTPKSVEGFVHEGEKILNNVASDLNTVKENINSSFNNISEGFQNLESLIISQQEEQKTEDNLEVNSTFEPITDFVYEGERVLENITADVDSVKAKTEESFTNFKENYDQISKDLQNSAVLKTISDKSEEESEEENSTFKPITDFVYGGEKVLENITTDVDSVKAKTEESFTNFKENFDQISKDLQNTNLFKTDSHGEQNPEESQEQNSTFKPIEDFVNEGEKVLENIAGDLGSFKENTAESLGNLRENVIKISENVQNSEYFKTSENDEQNSTFKPIEHIRQEEEEKALENIAAGLGSVKEYAVEGFGNLKENVNKISQNFQSSEYFRTSDDEEQNSTFKPIEDVVVKGEEVLENVTSKLDSAKKEAAEGFENIRQNVNNISEDLQKSELFKTLKDGEPNHEESAEQNSTFENFQHKGENVLENITTNVNSVKEDVKEGFGNFKESVNKISENFQNSELFQTSVDGEQKHEGSLEHNSTFNPIENFVHKGEEVAENVTADLSSVKEHIVEGFGSIHNSEVFKTSGDAKNIASTEIFADLEQTSTSSPSSNLFNEGVKYFNNFAVDFSSDKHSLEDGEIIKNSSEDSQNSVSTTISKKAEENSSEVVEQNSTASPSIKLFNEGVKYFDNLASDFNSLTENIQESLKEDSNQKAEEDSAEVTEENSETTSPSIHLYNEGVKYFDNVASDFNSVRENVQADIESLKENLTKTAEDSQNLNTSEGKQHTAEITEETNTSLPSINLHNEGIQIWDTNSSLEKVGDEVKSIENEAKAKIEETFQTTSAPILNFFDGFNQRSEDSQHMQINHYEENVAKSQEEITKTEDEINSNKDETSDNNRDNFQLTSTPTWFSLDGYNKNQEDSHNSYNTQEVESVTKYKEGVQSYENSYNLGKIGDEVKPIINETEEQIRETTPILTAFDRFNNNSENIHNSQINDQERVNEHGEHINNFEKTGDEEKFMEQINKSPILNLFDSFNKIPEYSHESDINNEENTTKLSIEHDSSESTDSIKTSEKLIETQESLERAASGLLSLKEKEYLNEENDRQTQTVSAETSSSTTSTSTENSIVYPKSEHAQSSYNDDNIKRIESESSFIHSSNVLNQHQLGENSSDDTPSMKETPEIERILTATSEPVEDAYGNYGRTTGYYQNYQTDVRENEAEPVVGHDLLKIATKLIQDEDTIAKMLKMTQSSIEEIKEETTEDNQSESYHNEYTTPSREYETNLSETDQEFDKKYEEVKNITEENISETIQELNKTTEEVKDDIDLENLGYEWKYKADESGSITPTISLKEVEATNAEQQFERPVEAETTKLNEEEHSVNNHSEDGTSSVTQKQLTSSEYYLTIEKVMNENHQDVSNENLKTSEESTTVVGQRENSRFVEIPTAKEIDKVFEYVAAIRDLNEMKADTNENITTEVSTSTNLERSSQPTEESTSAASKETYSNHSQNQPTEALITFATPEETSQEGSLVNFKKSEEVNETKSEERTNEESLKSFAIKEDGQSFHTETITQSAATESTTTKPNEDSTTSQREFTTNMPSKFEQELNMAVKHLEATTHHHFEEFQMNLQKAFKTFTDWEAVHKKPGEETATTEVNAKLEETTQTSDNTKLEENTHNEAGPKLEENIQQITTEMETSYTITTTDKSLQEDTTQETTTPAAIPIIIAEDSQLRGAINEQFIDKFDESFRVETLGANISKPNQETDANTTMEPPTNIEIMMTTTSATIDAESTATSNVLTTMSTPEEKVDNIQEHFTEFRVSESTTSEELNTLKSDMQEEHSTVKVSDVPETTMEAQETTTEDIADTTIIPLFARVQLQKDVNSVSLIKYDDNSSEEDTTGESHIISNNAEIANKMTTEIPETTHEIEQQISKESQQEQTSHWINTEEKITQSTPETFIQEMVTFIQPEETSTWKHSEAEQTQVPLTQATFMEERQQQIESTTENDVTTHTAATAAGHQVSEIPKEHETTTAKERTTTTEAVIYSTTIVEADSATTTVIPESLQNEPEARALALPPPKLEYLQNEDGVEVFYGYSTVKRN